jgi:dienelactone hydrolase
MTDVLLFHHALGVTDGIEAFADRLRRGGHHVVVIDLFNGQRFDSIEDGVAHAEEVGFDTITDRGVAAADGLRGPVVTVGFSLGVLPAQKLAQTNPVVVGAVLCHGAVPPSAFGERWRDGVDVQVHLVEGDPWAAEDLDAARSLAQTAGGELFLYPGRGHLVSDSSHDDYDPTIATQITERTLAFLDARS